MNVFVHTDHTVDGSERLTRHIETEIAAGLQHFAARLQTVDVHLSSDNAGNPGAAVKRCVLEAISAGTEPVVVTDQASTVEAALAGAVHKLDRLLEGRAARLHSRGGRSSIRRP